MQYKQSLTTRLLLIVMIPLILGSALLFVASVSMMQRVFQSGYKNSADIIVKTLDSSIGSIDELKNKTNLQNQILKLIYNNPEIVRIQVNIFDPEGKLISFVSSDSSMEGQEVIVGDNAPGQNSRSEYISSVPIEVAGKIVGSYEVALSYSESYRLFTLQMYYFLIGSVILYAMVIVMILYLSRKQIINPIKDLIVGAEKIGSGDFSYRLVSVKDDEIGQLAKAINIAAEKLDKFYEDIEDKVDSKTVELNKRLIELDAKNIQMGKSEMAMLNVLEDSRELEKQLAEEKKGVEKKVEERTKELSAEKAKLLASISALPRAIVIVDKNHQIVTQNGKLVDIFGEIDGEWDIKKIDAKLGNIFNLSAKLDYVLEQKKIFDIDEFVYGAKFLEVYMAPIFDDDHELIGAAITVNDATEAKVLSRSKDEFFSIASHELRTPLTAIRGNTSMILDYYKEALKDPELLEMIVDTHDASIRLIGIVNDFLDMSRLEMGKVEYKLEDVKLLEIVGKVVKDLEENAKTKGVELKASGDEKVIAKADVGKVEQVLFNIIGNSLKFTDKGSVTINVTSFAGFAQIEVSDTGKGIPLANQGLLFHKFQQAGSSLTTREGAKGTGLGLYISKLMAEGMGGKLELIKSEEGKGSVFGIKLPLGGNV